MLRSEPVAYPLVTNGTFDLHLSRHRADKRRPMPRMRRPASSPNARAGCERSLLSLAFALSAKRGR